jgi:hypothetical protein
MATSPNVTQHHPSFTSSPIRSVYKISLLPFFTMHIIALLSPKKVRQFRSLQPDLRMHISSTISALILSSVLVTANDYAATCGQFSLYPNQYTMQAVCGDGKGGYRTSQENLDLCIGNANGVLVAQNEFVFLFRISSARIVQLHLP